LQKRPVILRSLLIVATPYWIPYILCVCVCLCKCVCKCVCTRVYTASQAYIHMHVICETTCSRHSLKDIHTHTHAHRIYGYMWYVWDCVYCARHMHVIFESTCRIYVICVRLCLLRATHACNLWEYMQDICDMCETVSAAHGACYDWITYILYIYTHTHTHTRATLHLHVVCTCVSACVCERVCVCVCVCVCVRETVSAARGTY